MLASQQQQQHSSATHLPRASSSESSNRRGSSLSSDIDDLRRFSRLSRRLRMRSAGNCSQQQQQQAHQLQKFERHAVQRRSMPEIQRADLVYLRMPSGEMASGQSYRSEERLSDWKPRTEFERIYFGDVHDNPRPSSSLNYYECNDQHLLKKLDGAEPEPARKFDQNSNLIDSELSAKIAEDDYYDPELPRRIDDYVVPHSPEFRTSRERLHEIFEHNRYLRRKFFADLPNGSSENEESEKQREAPAKYQAAAGSRAGDFPKTSGLGFGSTETLTSQSNQSAGSSTDGRKSRAEFGNTPDSVDFEQPKPEPAKMASLPLTYFGTDRYGGTWRSATRGVEAKPRSDEPDAPAPPREPSSGKDARKSMPDLSPNTIVRLSVNGSAIDLTRDYGNLNGEASKTGKDDDSDTKYFASYAHVTDDSSDGDSKSPSPSALEPLSARRKHKSCSQLEPERLRSCKDEEKPSGRRFDLAWSPADRQIAKSRESLLRSSRSLLELSSSASATTSLSSGNRRETRIERMIRRRGQSAFNKSCSDLSAMMESSYSSRLLSPRLVGNALAASRERIAELVEEEEEEEEDNRRWKTLTPEQTPAGTTLPSVYGPIPYKSPRRYVEGEVTIHYRSPVRSEAKEPLSEEELARRSAENMRRVYQEERRRKYLQELHDIDSRRHTDNFIPSQKSPIPLNRYDDFVDDLSYRSHSQEQTPEPRLVARALYNFVGQTPRELTFRRGDLIFVRRQVDKNWYEGEHNAMIGLFPFNYVEIIPYDEIRTLPKKSYEGQARAKFNFIAQTNLELSLAKGELVCLTRRVDENWWEGRVGNRKGIFPVSYVEVLNEPGPRPETPIQNKPVASPAAHSMLSNGTSSGKLSMGPHHYSPTLPVNVNTTQPHYNSLPKGGVGKLHVAPVNETLHIDTHSEPIPYRALYNYRPQNEDELELNEGDTVYVMEKCDDGWYVGSSQRTGYFGTFPGNYVERL